MGGEGERGKLEKGERVKKDKQCMGISRYHSFRTSKEKKKKKRTRNLSTLSKGRRNRKNEEKSHR